MPLGIFLSLLETIDDPRGQRHGDQRIGNSFEGNVAQRKGQHRQVSKEVGIGDAALHRLGDGQGQGIVPAGGAPPGAR